jgi:hypothetical protein
VVLNSFVDSVVPLKTVFARILMSKEEKIKINISLHLEGSRLTDVEEFDFENIEEMIKWLKKEKEKYEE